MTFQRFGLLSLGFGLATALTACGGGGSSSTTTTATPSTTTSSTSTTTPTATPTPVIDFRDAYVGTWVSCGTSTSVKSGSEFVRQQISTVLNKSASNTMALTGTTTTKFFSPSDFGCKNTVLGTDTRSVTWTFGTATKTMTLTPNVVTATALNWSGPAPGGVSAGITVTIGGLSYPGSFFTTPLNTDLYAYSPETGKLYVADASATVFDTSAYPVMIKQ